MKERAKPRYVRSGNVIDEVRAVAYKHGYAVAVHGSMRRERDIDLVAVPWVKGAHSPRTLMYAIDKLIYLDRVKKHDLTQNKPHGRLGYIWLIRFRAADCPAYVDLSIMPRS